MATDDKAMPDRPVYVLDNNAPLVDALTKAHARFMVIGGMAAYWHVPERGIGSNDLDLLADPTRENAARVIDALHGMQVTPNFTVEEFVSGKYIKLKQSRQFPTCAFYADILTPPKGVEVGEEHWGAATKANMEHCYEPVLVASIPTLLLLLRKAPPSKDPEKRASRARDIELLERALEARK